MPAAAHSSIASGAASLGASGHERDQVEHLSRAGRQPARPRVHRVADRRRHLAARAGEDLGHEERIAAGRLVHSLVGAPRAAGQLADRVLRQYGKADAADRVVRQLAEDEPERVSRAQLVVAIGDDQQGGRLADTPAHVLEDVERGVVRPVHVLEDGDGNRRRAPQLAQEGGEDPLALRAALHQRPERAPGVVGDVEQRAERPGGEQRVARPPEDAGGRSIALGELREPLNQRRLADPRLAGDESDGPIPASDAAQRRQELVEKAVALEKVHVCAVRGAGGPGLTRDDASAGAVPTMWRNGAPVQRATGAGRRACARVWR
jgi:hypothetical protein